MEDVTVIHGVLAVLDGHGGRECADYVAARLPLLATLPQDEWSDTFSRFDDEFREQGQLSGSTCVVVSVSGDRLEGANLGDSRAVLFRSGCVEAQTIDHKPGSPQERERITRCGGAVKDDPNGPSRVGGVAVSRAFGTFVSPLNRQMLKDPDLPHTQRVLSCLPDLFTWPAKLGDVVVLACDGVWDVLEVNDISAILFEQIDGQRRNVTEYARLICERALRTSTDNVSCIVAELGGAHPKEVVQEIPATGVARPCQTKEWRGFNRASAEEQLSIGSVLEYGDTLIQMLDGLETDMICEGLWLGQCGDACYLPFLQDANITKVVNCAADVERPHIEGIDVHSLRWRDSEEQGKAEVKSAFKRLTQATKFIEDSLKAGDVVMVHCVQGISRSAAVVTAFLMEHRDMPMDDAVALVREKHPGALKPFRFQEMLRAFGYHLIDSRA
eukprot:TRINITY_DN32128_c0_g1_i1.p1 TRINITY_DN32128_c0_g1~~TRINITY_DN32128_c0_g1_i1.p1  ORF type:complete len:496 (+),score=63.13 TRINITY_DN32128_c0_g1_i1:165-1490(+)